MYNKISEEQKQRELEEKAVQACVARYKNHGSINRMNTVVEEYFKFMVGHIPQNRETYLDHRKLAAQRLAILCIGQLNREQLASLNCDLRSLWKNPPEEYVRWGRGL